jgi:hypothetical protein
VSQLKSDLQPSLLVVAATQDALENIAGYQPKGAYTADVLGSVTGDVYLSAHEILRPAVWM